MKTLENRYRINLNPILIIHFYLYRMQGFFGKLILPLLLSLPLLLVAQNKTSQSPPEIRFTNISNIEGMTSNHINSMIRDNLGFIWLATNDGLYRYESSNQLKAFYTTTELEEQGLKSSNIRVLHIDSKENLWVGTRLGGLSRLHLPTDTWKTYQNDPSDAKSISNNEVLSIIEDSKGQIWIGTENGLNLFESESESFIRFMWDEKNPWALQTKAVLTILEDDKGWIWVGTWAGGVHLLIPSEDGNIENSKFRRFFPEENKGSHNLWEIYQDNDKRYWLATHGEGLFLMQLPKNSSNKFSDQNWEPNFHKYSNVLDDELTISNNYVQDIQHDRKGNLWLGSVYGANIIRAETLENLNVSSQQITEKPPIVFERYIYSKNDPESVIHNNIHKIYEDQQGIIWISTFSGISKYNWSANQFEIYEFNGEGVKENNIQSIYVDQDKTIWLANTNGGLLTYNIKTDELKNLSKLNENLLVDDFVTYLKSDDGIHLYVGTFKGLTILNMQTLESQHLPTPDWIRKQTSQLFIRDILKDQQGELWVASDLGLFHLDAETNKYTQYNHQVNDTMSLSDNSIHTMLEDSKGRIWVSTYNGLNRLIKKDGKVCFERFKNKQNDSTSIPSNRVTALEELDNKLYCGTTNGLCVFDFETEHFTNISKTEHKYWIQGFQIGPDSMLWGSTNKCIFYFNPEKETFNIFEKRDGLGDLSFRPNAGVIDEDGTLYFGSRRGVTGINPKNIILNDEKPPVFITDVKIMSPKRDTSFNAIYKDEITLGHNDYHLTLHFSGLNYNRPEKNKFAYKLEGFNDDWTYLNNNLSAVYTNLDPGSYTFRVKASNNDGLWNEEGATLTIIKEAAFWQTWWFRGLCLICTAILIWSGVKVYTKNIHQNNLALTKYNDDLNAEIAERKRIEKALQEREQYMEVLVKQRTKELEIKKDEVEVLLDKIKIRNEELEVIVEKRTQRLRESNSELMRSNEDLEQFAYIASHDLQEPLRIIGNFTGLLKRRYKNKLDSEALEYIDFTVDGVRRMSGLIKSILTYSRVGRKEGDYSFVSLDKTIESKLSDLSHVIKERNVEINIATLPKVFCEQSQIGMIFYNLINNAIKFNKSERPKVDVSYIEEENSNFWTFAVKDNGIGISKEYQDRIFEIFRRLHAKKDYEGTGIGLALCKKIILRHGGKIWIESEPDKGATFFFSIHKDLESKIKESTANKELLNPSSN